METFFFENCQPSLPQWTGRQGGASGMVSVADPLTTNRGTVCTFSSTTGNPNSFSKTLVNPQKTYAISFDYLGKSSNINVGSNFGCVFSVADGASLSSTTFALAGDLSFNRGMPMCDTRIVHGSSCMDLCQEPGPYYYGCVSSYQIQIYYQKDGTYTGLAGRSAWKRFSMIYTASNENIRLALGDFIYANHNDPAYSGDCFFDNILVSSLEGPSPFLATSSSDAFSRLTIDAIGAAADTVSYENSNAAVSINLGMSTASGGYATGDKLNDIPNLIGTSFNDVLIGSSTNNRLSGGAGNDVLTATGGTDVLKGGTGADRFIILNDVSGVTIEDFEITNDILDLSSWNGLYTLSDILAITTHQNGNSIISLTNSIKITLNNVMPNNLLSSSLILALPPTAIPTFFPTPLPTTVSPSVRPTLSPTAPTESPTFSPTAIPSTAPTFLPTTTPSLSPSNVPSLQPSTNHFILKGDTSTFVGGPYQKFIIVDSPSDLVITLNNGNDNIIFLKNPFAQTVITDFSPQNSTIIDLSSFSEITSFSQLKDLFSKQGGTKISFLNHQAIIFLDVFPADLNQKNFVFYSSKDSSQTSTSWYNNYVPFWSIPVTFGGTVCVGTIFYYYFKYVKYNHSGKILAV